MKDAQWKVEWGGGGGHAPPGPPIVTPLLCNNHCIAHIAFENVLVTQSVV